MIKFRAWDKGNELIKGVIAIYLSENAVELHFQHGENPEYKQLYEVELMQSTGLKDKNGVEIYEGDIVILCWSDEVGESHWGKVIIKNPFEYTPEEARYFIYSDEIEVIGNIYENPELLEVQNASK